MQYSQYQKRSCICFGHNQQFEHIIFKSISSIAAYQSSYTKCSLDYCRSGWDHVMLQVELKEFSIG